MNEYEAHCRKQLADLPVALIVFGCLRSMGVPITKAFDTALYAKEKDEP